MSEADHSPNVSYRDLDVEFLTKQARIWLEAVLGQRFDGKTSLADLLADGEILEKVASRIQNLVQHHTDLDLPSPQSLHSEASFDGKHSKYLPYINVDSFLKVCQKLGLTGVDLFSPPDVVEKRDIRRVCLCIRILSKKARAKQLRVPNFDYVSHTVPMSTEFVGGRRESLNKASNSPKGTENRETTQQSQVQSSPLRFGSTGDAGASVESSDSSSESSVSGENGSEDNKNADFLKGSRSSGLFDDYSHHSEDSSHGGHIQSKPSDSFDPSLDSSCESSLNQEIPGKDWGHKHSWFGSSVGNSEKEDSKQRGESDQPVSTTEESADRGKKDTVDHSKAKKWRFWVPFVAAVVALIGSTLVIRAREPQMYEVKKGDTLSQISKKAGKSSWEELARLNPGIMDPDLIYPSERLRLHS